MNPICQSLFRNSRRLVTFAITPALSLLSLAVLLLSMALSPVSLPSHAPAARPSSSDQATKAQVNEAFGKLPLSFEANDWQVASAVWLRAASTKAAGPCLSVKAVAITETEPGAVVPVNTLVTLHGVASLSCVTGETPDTSDVTSDPLPHRWVVVKQPSSSFASLATNDPDPTEPGNPTSTSASFKPDKVGEYIVRLEEVLPGGVAGKSKEIAITAFEAPPGEDYWKSIGPRGTLTPDKEIWGGHVYAVAIAHTDPAASPIIYAGAADGGVWKHDGKGWAQLTDNKLIRNGRGTLSVRSLVLDPSDSNTIYAGSAGGRLGVFRSTDGGGSWFPTGSDEARCDNGEMASREVPILAIDPSQPAVIFAGTDQGLFRSADRGACWLKQGKATLGFPSELPQTGDALPQTGYVDNVVIDPDNPKVVYAVFSGSGIYKLILTSTRPPALKWTKLGGGLPTRSLKRIALAIAPSDPKILYAGFTIETPTSDGKVTDVYRLFKTTNRGVDWIELPSSSVQRCDDQCNHNNVIAVHPINASIVFVGHVPLFFSTDGGMNWVDVSWPPKEVKDKGLVKGTDMHGDNHAIVFDPLKPSIFYNANDGGVTKGNLESGVLTREQFTGKLVIGQFSRIGIAPSDANTVAGGLWHNANLLTHDGGKVWEFFGEGDGVGAQIDAADANIVYRHQNYGFGGAIYREKRTATPEVAVLWRIVAKCTDPKTGEVKDLEFTPGNSFWTDPYRPGDFFRLDYADPTLFKGCVLPSPPPASGEGRLYRTQGANTKAPGDLIWTRLTPPGSHKITSFAIKRRTGVDEKPVYFVGTTTGAIWRGEPDGAGWEEVLGDLSPARSVAAIASDPADPNRIFAIFSKSDVGRVGECRKRAGKWACVSIDATFKPSGNPPPTLNDLIVDPLAADTIYVASDQGIFRVERDTAGAWRWSQAPGMPTNADVRDLAAHERFIGSPTGVMRAATYGRGIWELVRAPKSKPITTGDEISDCTVTETDDPALQTRVRLLRVNYHYNPARRSNVRLRAKVLRNGKEQSFFALTTPQLTQPLGAATLMIGYLNKQAPLSLETDAIRLELFVPGQAPLATHTCAVRQLWKRPGAVTLEAAAIGIGGEEGGARQLNAGVIITTPQGSRTLTTPFAEVLGAGAQVTLTAPSQVKSNDNRVLNFVNWASPGAPRASGNSITLALGADTFATANYRPSQPVRETREELRLTATSVATQVCALNASHNLDVSWQTSGGAAPRSVTILVTPPVGQKLAITQLSAAGTRTIPLNAPSGGSARVEVIARDFGNFTASTQSSVQLKACKPK